MAINPDNTLDAQHTCYCGATGSGKGVALKLAGKVGQKAVIFDPYGEYRQGKNRKLSGLGGGRKVHQYTTRKSFANAFIEAWKSGKGFAVSYYPKQDVNRRNEALWLASLIWAAADGKRRLDVVFEEMGTYMETSGTDGSIIQEIATGGRKYALHAHFLFQRPQQVPKSIINQCPFMLIGAQEAMSDVKHWVDRLNCTIDDVINLGKLNQKTKKHYLYKVSGVGNFTNKVFTF
jgi:hypothetical protein